ncbi:hypothetical protein D3C85_1473010 [compost metagenome]
MSAGCTPARVMASCMAARAPAPAGSGADIWCASDVSPQPASRTGPASRDIRNSAAPSPRLMPWRWADSGLHRSALTESSERKPAIVNAHSVSTPPAMATSAMPCSSSRAAAASAFALDEHAVEIV